MSARECLVSWSVCAPWAVLAAASAHSGRSKRWLFMLFPVAREEDPEIWKDGRGGRQNPTARLQPWGEIRSPGTLICDGDLTIGKGI